MNGAVPRAFQRRLAKLAFGRKARVDCFRMIADLLDAEFELERALEVTIRCYADQGQSLRAWVLADWRRALLANRFAAGVGATVSAAEAMIFTAYGRIEAGVLFAAAARVAELRERQIAAIWKAVAMPLVLVLGLVVLLWAAGGHFVPVMESVVPAERWGLVAGYFRVVSTWLYGNVVLFTVFVGAVIAGVSAMMVFWTGPGRVFLDRMPPFSLYRMFTGSAFLFVVLEFLGAGVDLNDRAFEDLKRGASPYARHRIGTIQGRMARGAGLGRAMALAGHGFPDPSLVPVVVALDGAEGWEAKLARFVERWVGRSEDLLRARAAGLNGVLLVVVTLALGAGIDAMLSILQEAGVQR